MSLKKKLGSKLANSVRQVKSQREQTPAVPAKTVVVEKTAVKPIAVLAASKPTATRTANKIETDSLHPQRIWPD